MRKNTRGYIYVNLLLVVLIALGFVLSGGFILSKRSSSTTESTELYKLVDKEANPSNPTLQLSTLDLTPCGLGGLDIVLVIDNSGSISGQNIENKDYLPDVKDALISFVDSFSGKSTLFSVTTFNNKADPIIPGFTDNLEEVKTKIGSIRGGGSTNWQDALIKAKESLGSTSNRPSNPDLVIFFSDGLPNTIVLNGTTKRFDDGAAEAIDPAVIVANEIKSRADGTSIIAYGIGSVVSQNLQKISEDVVVTTFADFAADLAALTVASCGP
jgi:Mg-chelatase subunit ChlD